MSSVLTNTGAMIALQTLKSTNANLAKTQSDIATGKSVANAKDNAAVWAISKVMESDVQGFKGIQESLSLGQSTVSVARKASESVTDLLTKMKGKIVAAQTANADDQTKLQTDIVALREQIGVVVTSSQVNGKNLVDGGASSSASFLSSLSRDDNGNVTAATIAVAGQDLSTTSTTVKDVFSAATTGITAADDVTGFKLEDTAGTGTIVIDDTGTSFAAGDSLSVTIGGKTATYTVTAEDVAATSRSEVVSVGLKNAIDTLGISGLEVDYDSTTVPGTLNFSNTGAGDLAVSAQFKGAGSGNLAGLNSIDVASAGGAAAALGNIEALIETATNAASYFGSKQSQLETQSNFVSSLTDSLKSSIGSMVDADMEETSARLQALQVQQQLGVQALSMANQAPQSILSLFR